MWATSVTIRFYWMLEHLVETTGTDDSQVVSRVGQYQPDLS